MSGKSIWTTLLMSALPLLAQAPSIAEGGVLNGASFTKGQAVAAGALVSVFGSNLASRLALADSIPLSNSLGDVSVTFNGVPAPMVAVVPGGTGAADQINLQVPWNALSQGTVSGPAAVVVTRGVPPNSTASQPSSVQIGQFGPGIFSVQYGVGIAIAINADGSLAAAQNAVPGIATRPAKIGDRTGLMILGTGLGAVDPPGQTGRDSLDALRRATTTPIVLVGGVPATVLFAGMSPQFPGVNQINIVVPRGAQPGDAVPLQIQLGDITTTDKVTIAIVN